LKTNTTNGRRTLLRRAKATIAALVTLIAMAGAVQTAMPISAMAVTAHVDCRDLAKAAERARNQGNWQLAAIFEEQREQCERDEAKEEEEEHP